MGAQELKGMTIALGEASAAMEEGLPVICSRRGFLQAGVVLSLAIAGCGSHERHEDRSGVLRKVLLDDLRKGTREYTVQHVEDGVLLSGGRVEVTLTNYYSFTLRRETDEGGRETFQLYGAWKKEHPPVGLRISEISASGDYKDLLDIAYVDPETDDLYTLQQESLIKLMENPEWEVRVKSKPVSDFPEYGQNKLLQRWLIKHGISLKFGGLTIVEDWVYDEEEGRFVLQVQKKEEAILEITEDKNK